MVAVALRMRRIGIALVCAASVALGLALVRRFVTREALTHVSTGELLALLGLFVLPVATVLAIALERRGASPTTPPPPLWYAMPIADAVAAVPTLPEEAAAAAAHDRPRAVRRPRAHRRRFQHAPGAGSPA